MKPTLLIFFLSVFSLSLSAQTPLVWERFYDQNGDERIKDVTVCKDGSILFCGFSSYSGDEDPVLYTWYGKLNVYGDLLWTGTWHKMQLSSGNAFIQTSDERNFLVGFSDQGARQINGHALYTWISEDGKFSEPKFYGGQNQYYEFDMAAECSDGTLISAGKAGKEMFMARISSAGQIITAKTYWLDSPGIIYDFKEKANGNIIVAGGLYGEDKDLLIFEVDKNLDLLWKKTINKAYLEEIQSICLTRDGGYIAAGTRYDRNTGKSKGWYAKFNSSFQTVWEYEVGGFPLENNDIRMLQYGPNSYAMGMNKYGESLGDGISKNHDVGFVIFDGSGNTLWEYTYATNKIEYFYDLTVGTDMNLIAAGELFESDTASDGFIYCFKPKLKPLNIPVYVFSKETSKPIMAATVSVKHEDGTLEALTTSEAGLVKVELSREERCEVQIVALGYEPLNDAFTLSAEAVTQQNKYFLINARPGTSMVMKSVNFERSTPDLLPGAYAELDRLARFLIEHPEMRIELAGHTDNGGTDEYNQQLSEQRVAAVKYYLVEKGIAPGRIKGRGYGGRKPIAPNDTEENKSKNRRVEVKVL